MADEVDKAIESLKTNPKLIGHVVQSGFLEEGVKLLRKVVK